MAEQLTLPCEDLLYRQEKINEAKELSEKFRIPFSQALRFIFSESDSEESK